MPANNYITLAQVKAYAPTNEVSTSTVWDATVTTLCANLSRAFDTLTERHPGAYAVTAASAKYYDGVKPTATDYIDSLLVDEMADAPAEVAISNSGGAYVALASADYFPWPDNADGIPYTRIDLNPYGQTKTWGYDRRRVRVTAKFGYSQTVPADVLEAMLLYVVRLMKKVQQNFQEVGQLLDSGVVLIGMRRDEDLQTLIAYYRNSRL